MRGDIQISSDGLEPNVSISYMDCDKVSYRSTPIMEIDTMDLNCPIDASALSFVCSSLTNGMGHYGSFKLCEAVSFNAAFSTRKCYSSSQFLFDAVDIFSSEMRTLIFPVIKRFSGQTVIVFCISMYHLVVIR